MEAGEPARSEIFSESWMNTRIDISHPHTKVTPVQYSLRSWGKGERAARDRESLLYSPDSHSATIGNTHPVPPAPALRRVGCHCPRAGYWSGCGCGRILDRGSLFVLVRGEGWWLRGRVRHMSSLGHLGRRGLRMRTLWTVFSVVSGWSIGSVRGFEDGRGVRLRRTRGGFVDGPTHGYA